MTTRRTFLQAVGAATAAASTGIVSRELLASARADKLGAIGLQLYTVRSLMQKDVDGTLEAVAKIGYREVEFAGYFNREPAALRATLDRLKLTSPSCHVGLDAVEAGFAATAAAAKTLGHKWITVASTPGRFFQSVASLKDLAQHFNDAGKRAKSAGLRFAYHNHNVEFKVIEGTIPLELLISETDPSLVDFEMDCYWVENGGGDPLALFKKFPGRFHLLHAKDSSGPPDHKMRDVGAGVIDWTAILAEKKKAGIEHVFVEHDQPTEPIESIKASFEYLHSLQFQSR